MGNESEVLLWASLKQGEWEAYTELYNIYFLPLSNYGYKFTRDRELIEDAIHDLFVRLWGSRKQLGDPVSVKNYLFKAMRNIILRKMKVRDRITDLEGQHYPVYFPIAFTQNPAPADMESRELRAKLQSYINGLPPRQQEIIYLRFYEGSSYVEIADIMSISINSTYKLLYKALDSLQTALGHLPPAMLVILFGKESFF